MQFAYCRVRVLCAKIACGINDEFSFNAAFGNDRQTVFIVVVVVDINAFVVGCLSHIFHFDSKSPLTNLQCRDCAYVNHILYMYYASLSCSLPLYA